MGKSGLASLSSNVVPRLIWKSGIQWWYSLFLFLTINIFLAQIWSKNSKLFVQGELWYKDQFEYAKFNGGVYFTCFKMFLSKFRRSNRMFVDVFIAWVAWSYWWTWCALPIICNSKHFTFFVSIVTYQIKFPPAHHGY